MVSSALATPVTSREHTFDGGVDPVAERHW
jgi:hypothetical protein